MSPRNSMTATWSRHLCRGSGVAFNQDYVPVHHSSRTSIAQHDGIHSPAANNDAVRELRPVTAAVDVRVPWPNMQHAARIRAENGVEFGEDFFCHRH